MSEENMGEKLPGSILFFVIGALSIAWLMAAFVFVSQFGERCRDGSVFSCLGPSEWGDFLAGVFAPMAFFWLVATVWIQSRELRAQREELILTRKEFQYNREVMKSQAEEARKQAEYIGQQTNLLQHQEQARLEVEKNNIFLSYIGILAARIKKIKQGPYIQLSHSKSLNYVDPIIELSTDQDWIRHFREQIYSFVRTFQKNEYMYEGALDPGEYISLYEAVVMCVGASKGLQGANLVQAKGLSLMQIQSQLQFFIGEDPELQQMLMGPPDEA